MLINSNATAPNIFIRWLFSKPNNATSVPPFNCYFRPMGDFITFIQKLIRRKKLKFNLSMAWVYLVCAGLFEVAFTTSLKLSNNFTHKGWSTVFFISITLSFYLLNRAIQTIPMGTGYAVWTGICAVGTALVGILFFDEPAFFWRVFFITLLIGSIVGLKFVSA